MTPQQANDALRSHLPPERFLRFEYRYEGSTTMEEQWTIACPDWSHSHKDLATAVNNILALLKNAKQT